MTDGVAFTARLSLLALAIVVFMLSGNAHAHSQGQHVDKQAAADHARSGDYTVRAVQYVTPGVKLLDQSGTTVELTSLLDGNRPVLMQFIFTTCATICPVMGATFSQAQAQLLAAHPDTQLISISIDPEHDSPARLREFGQRFGAATHWQFLTGSAEDIRRVMRAFDVLYASDNKMYHQFNTFLRTPSSTSWVRLVGMPGASELVAEYRAVLSRR